MIDECDSVEDILMGTKGELATDDSVDLDISVNDDDFAVTDDTTDLGILGVD